MRRGVDIVTLAIVDGLFNSVEEEMSVVVERTARSGIFKLAKDYSNTILDGLCRQVVQGERSIPCHVGAAPYACRAVVDFFGDNIHPGDVFYHNDPTTGASHLIDLCAFRPVFYEGDLVFWTAAKGHVIDIGGAAPSSYYVLATEIYQEGIRIPPLKLYERGRQKIDVTNLLMANVRYPEQEWGDLMAQIAATATAERSLLAVLQKYGKQTIRDCIEELFNLSERNTRARISSWPDGVYKGSSWMEGLRGAEDIEIKTTVTVEGDRLRVDLDSPPQRYDLRNSYEGNTRSAIYHAIIIALSLTPPFNHGVYKCITVNPGPKGTFVNATLPAPCAGATTQTYDCIMDAMRDALSKGMPLERLTAGWSHPGTGYSSGVNPETHKPYTHYHSLFGCGGGSGATWGGDGWNVIGHESPSGAVLGESIELLEYEDPLHVHRAEFQTDSGCAGKWRGGLGVDYEYEAINHPQRVDLGTVREKFFALSVGGAKSKLIEPKLGWRYVVTGEEKRFVPGCTLVEVGVGERFLSYGPGGGGIGDPFDRDPELVREDVINELVSINGAAEEYGVIINPETLEIDVEATTKARGRHGL